MHALSTRIPEDFGRRRLLSSHFVRRIRTRPLSFQSKVQSSFQEDDAAAKPGSGVSPCG